MIGASRARAFSANTHFFEGGKDSIPRSKLITPERGIISSIKIRYHFEAVTKIQFRGSLYQ